MIFLQSSDAEFISVSFQQGRIGVLASRQGLQPPSLKAGRCPLLER